MFCPMYFKSRFKNCFKIKRLKKQEVQIIKEKQWPLCNWDFCSNQVDRVDKNEE